MAKSISKVQKAISKKKGSKANSLHENSRDFKKLRRAASRNEKLETRGKQRNVAREVIGNLESTRVRLSVQLR